MSVRCKNIILIFILIILLFVFLFILLAKPYIDISYDGKNVDNIEILLNDKLDKLVIKGYYLNKDVSSKIKTNNNVNTEKVGTYKIDYNLKIFIYNIHKSLKVSVVEKEKPIIELKGESETVSCSSSTYVEEGYSAYDNYDGDITDKVIIERLNDSILYKVSDSSGNTFSITRKIISNDESAPEIKLNGNEIIYLELGSEYEDEGYSVSDNCDKEVTNTSVNGSVNTNEVGEYKIEYNAIDSNGNKGVKTRYVYVYDKTSGKSNSESEKGIIYLTFDDGPSIYTSKILDTLKKYDIKATFFVTNNGKDSLIKREYDEGHSVALHTASHNYKKVYSSVDAYFKDLNSVSSRVLKITNEKPTIIRFPGGSSNTISKNYKKGIMTTLTKEVQNRGYHYFDWTASVEDAGKCASKKTDELKQTCVYNRFVKGLSKNKSNVILMHDIKPYTAEKLDDMIKYALSTGYKFDRITMTTKQVHHTVNN